MNLPVRTVARIALACSIVIVAPSACAEAGKALLANSAAMYVSNSRGAEVQLDGASLLVRSVEDDSPDNLPEALVSRTTVSYESLANPALDDNVFRFTIPEKKRAR